MRGVDGVEVGRRGATQPATVGNVRAHNLALVLDHVVRHGPRSRARLAAATGLNRTTVSSLVAELIDRRLLRESTVERPGAVGRPAIALELDPTRWVGLGLEVNVEHLAVSVRDLVGQTRSESIVRRPNDTSPPEETLAALAALAEQVMQPLRDAGLRCAGAVLGLPGLVDITARHLHVAPNLGWADLEVAAMLEALLDDGVTVWLENEANLGALAEHADGVARGRDEVVYVSADIGVGGAVLIAGQLQRGTKGFAGELGHVPVTHDGALCGCGRHGCLEAYIGQRALLARAGRDPLRAASGSDPRWPITELAAAARRGDPQVLAALDEAARHLGFALAGAANVLNPSTVVLGGFLGLLAEWLVGPVSEALRHRVIGAEHSPTEVLGSWLSVLAPARGGAVMAVRALLEDPTRTDRLAPIDA